MTQLLAPCFGSGKNGVLNVTTDTSINTYSSCSGSSGSTSLTVTTTGGFQAGDLIKIHKSRGNTTTTCGANEFNRIVSVGSGSFTLLLPLANAYQDSGADQSQVIRIPEYSQANIASSVYPSDSWASTHNTGGIVILFCNGVTNIEASGGIQVSTYGFAGGPQVDNNNQGWQGEGTGGAGIQGSASANGSGAGGGVNANDSGAGGGNATVGESAGARVGGAASGSTDLATMTFGGGGGSSDNHTGVNGGCWGGNGGGIIIIYSRILTVAGYIAANGQDGGTRADIPGGGGAGGSILIVSQQATLGSGLVTANKGNKGNTLAGDGAAGRIRVEACSISGTTSPSASIIEGGQSYCGSLASIIA
ncbi:MAG: hypothetical protein WC549_00575 [Actinomycetota bacterium]